MGSRITRRAVLNFGDIVKKFTGNVDGSGVLYGVPRETNLDFGGESNAKGNVRKEDDVTNALLMFWHEKGNDHYPPRPVLRLVYRKNRKVLNQMFKQLFKEAGTMGEQAYQDELERIALFVEGLAKAEFTAGNLAPNAPSTIQQKGSSSPLIDTGDLRRSVRGVVKSDD